MAGMPNRFEPNKTCERRRAAAALVVPRSAVQDNKGVKSAALTTARHVALVRTTNDIVVGIQTGVPTVNKSDCAGGREVDNDLDIRLTHFYLSSHTFTSPPRVPRWPFHSFLILSCCHRPRSLRSSTAGAGSPPSIHSFLSLSKMFPTSPKSRLFLFTFCLLIFDFCCAYPSPYSYTSNIFPRQETQLTLPVTVTRTERIVT